MTEFADIAAEFDRRTARTIWCTLATGDGFTAMRLEATRVALFGVPPIVWGSLTS